MTQTGQEKKTYRWACKDRNCAGKIFQTDQRILICLCNARLKKSSLW
jgi:hypothetical protein